MYGIALRVWSRADDKRAETIRELRKRNEPDYYDTPDESYWIPYALSFLSRYPLFNLLGDYLRGMWIHWNKATNLFHAEYAIYPGEGKGECTVLTLNSGRFLGS